MIIASSIEQRNSIENARVCVGQPDGTWHVYLYGEELPPEVEASLQAPVQE
jgi:hypothetical protein